MIWYPHGLCLRVARASATLPQTAAHALFTIAGGNILVVQIYGLITVGMGAVANNTSLEGNPTAGTLETLCAVLNTANYALGDMLGITGVFADAMLPAATGGAMEGVHFPFIIKPGTLDLRCAANNTGEVAWVLHYMGLDAGVTVVAV